MKDKKLSIMEEEQIFSPWRTAFINFKARKVSVIAVFVFLFLFLSCMILPIFFPLDVNFHDVTQQNIPPGRTMLNVPPEMANNAKMISVGSTFSVGIDNNGNVHQWGIYPPVVETFYPVRSNRLTHIPEDMGRLKIVSAGLDHIIAVSEDNRVYTWGNIRHMLTNIPDNVHGRNIIQMEAGHQVSTALCDEGIIYVWGNTNFVSIEPRALQGRIKQYALNTSTVIALIDDGSVAALTPRDFPFVDIPESIGHNAVQVATTDRAAAALLNDGTVVVWGNVEYGEELIPPHIQGRIVSITGGRNHFSALLNDGSVFSWGRNDKGQTRFPNVSGKTFVETGYYQNFAIDSAGNITAWGFRGYLMGSDDLGRDIFLRLIFAGRLSMTIGMIAVVIAAIIGVIVGGISGYYAGIVDIILMRVAEVVGSMPFLVLCVILSAIIGNAFSETGRVVFIMVLLGLLSWPGLSRMTRAQFLAERENEYVTAARAVGIKEAVIIFRHILPNIFPIILVNLTLMLAGSMLTEAGLSFVGFGIREPNPTWGNMLMACVNSNVIANLWWRWVFPAAALGLTVLSINTIGDGFRDAIDPKSNER